MGLTNFPRNITRSNKLHDFSVVSSIPATGSAGYTPGCILQLTNASSGKETVWINKGTSTSCLFVPCGVPTGYSFAAGGGPVPSVSGSATQTITLTGVVDAADISFVEHQASDDTDTILAQIAGAGKITITGSADPLTAHAYNYVVVRNGAIGMYDVFAAGTVATTSGTTAEAITVTGAQASDLAFVGYSATDDTDTIVKAVVTTNTLTVTMSAAPGTTHGLHYAILRKRGSFKPSHYIYAAGVHTTVAGSASNTISIPGALATDVAIVKYNTTDDTDNILKSVVTTNTLTVTMSADPGTTHKLAYMLLRAY